MTGLNMVRGFAVLLASLASCCGASGAGILDQQQPIYDGGLNFRTSAGYTVWQSFTPSISGTLTEIDMGFFNDMSGTGQLDILSGEGSAGPILQSVAVAVVGITRPAVTWNVWTVAVPVTAGQLYTFRFTPNAATLPDPYGVALGEGNPYPRGVMGLSDSSGSYPQSDFESVFRTFVTPAPQEVPTIPRVSAVAFALALAFVGVRYLSGGMN